MEEKIRTLRKDRTDKRREKEIGKDNPPKKRIKIEKEQKKTPGYKEDTIRKRRHHQEKPGKPIENRQIIQRDGIQFGG